MSSRQRQKKLLYQKKYVLSNKTLRRVSIWKTKSKMLWRPSRTRRMTLLKNALFAEQIRPIGLAHPLVKENFMLRDRGRFAGIVIMRSTSRKIGD